MGGDKNVDDYLISELPHLLSNNIHRVRWILNG